MTQGFFSGVSINAIVTEYVQQFDVGEISGIDGTKLWD